MAGIERSTSTPGIRGSFNRVAGWRMALVLLLVGLLAGCGQSVLYSDLSEQQANEMIAALQSAGMSASKKETALQQSGVGYQVRVAQGDFPAAMRVLAAYRLPRPSYQSMCEMFKKEGFASSAIEERARYQCSLEQELAHTLSGIPGVAEARVHIALPEPDPLGNKTAGSSASVTIYERPGANVRDSETNIKATVKDGVEGLDDPNKVTVKFYSLGTSQANRQNPTRGPSIASVVNPTAIAIGAGVLVVLALVWALIGRMRARMAPQATTEAQAGSATPVWKK